MGDPVNREINWRTKASSARGYANNSVDTGPELTSAPAPAPARATPPMRPASDSRDHSAEMTFVSRRFSRRVARVGCLVAQFGHPGIDLLDAASERFPTRRRNARRDCVPGAQGRISVHSPAITNPKRSPSCKPRSRRTSCFQDNGVHFLAKHQLRVRWTPAKWVQAGPATLEHLRRGRYAGA